MLHFLTGFLPLALPSFFLSLFYFCCSRPFVRLFFLRLILAFYVKYWADWAKCQRKRRHYDTYIQTCTPYEYTRTYSYIYEQIETDIKRYNGDRLDERRKTAHTHTYTNGIHLLPAVVSHPVRATNFGQIAHGIPFRKVLRTQSAHILYTYEYSYSGNSTGTHTHKQFTLYSYTHSRNIYTYEHILCDLVPLVLNYTDSVRFSFINLALSVC